MISKVNAVLSIQKLNKNIPTSNGNGCHFAKNQTKMFGFWMVGPERSKFKPFKIQIDKGRFVGQK